MSGGFIPHSPVRGFVHVCPWTEIWGHFCGTFGENPVKMAIFKRVCLCLKLQCSCWSNVSYKSHWSARKSSSPVEHRNFISTAGSISFGRSRWVSSSGWSTRPAKQCTFVGDGTTRRLTWRRRFAGWLMVIWPAPLGLDGAASQHSALKHKRRSNVSGARYVRTCLRLEVWRTADGRSRETNFGRPSKRCLVARNINWLADYAGLSDEGQARCDVFAAAYLLKYEERRNLRGT